MKVSDLSFLFIYLQTTYSLLVEETTQDDVIEYVTVYEVPGDHYRSKRFSDADFPTKFHFLLEMSTQNISMNLARSVPIEQKTPIYSINKNGGILKVKDGSQRQYGIYQDSILGASIIVSRQIRDIHNIELFGSFTVDGKHYQIEPMSPSLRTRRTAGLRSSKGNNVDNIKHRIRRQTNPYGDFLGDELLPPVDSAGLNRPPLMPPYPGDLITMGPYDIPIIQLQEDKPSVLQGQEVTTGEYYSKDSTRQRRDTSQTLYIEYMAVVDYKNLERWKTMVDGNTDQEKLDNAFNVMQKYYQFIVNGIDVRFRTATISGPTIRVNLTNILVSTEKSTSPWIENNMLSENSIDDAGVLLDFATWRKSMIQYLPRHDHAGLFTGFDLATPTSLNPIGMGYLNSICHNSWAVSEIEETYNAITVHIAAHELGHNIGTRHDGNGNSCQSSSLYLMAPRLPTIYDPSIRTNPWTFSTCSQNAIKTFIDGLGSSNCLMDTPTKRNLKNELAGQIYNVDEQCNMTFGNDAALCRDNIYDQLDSVCYAMQCRQNGTNSCEGRFFPFDGTPCGDKKWCFSGQCIYSETAPPADESCLYGDDPNIDCTAQNACDVNDFLSSKVRCCRTCSQLPSTSSNIPTSSTSTIQSTTLSPPVSTTASSTISFTSTSQTTPSTSATTMTLSSTNTDSPSIKTNSPLTETSFTTTNSSYSTTHSQTSATTAQLTSTKSPFTTTYSKISTSSPSTTTSPSTKTNSEMPATTKQWTTMTTSTTGTPLSSVLDKELTFDLQTMISLFVTSALII